MATTTSTKFVHSIETFISGYNMTSAEKARERKLRPTLVSALNGFKKSRFELGRFLCNIGSSSKVTTSPRW